jgi:uncharacterized protein (DUF2062 family)
VTVAPAPEQCSAIERAWRRTRDIVVVQLRQGVTADKIALTLAIGLILGLFPIFGTTSALCVLAALWLKLNQPIIQLVNWFAAPLQLPGIYLFARIGERLTRSPPVQFSITGLVQQFRASPLLIAPVIAAVVYVVLLPPLRRLARLWGRAEGHGD